MLYSAFTGLIDSSFFFPIGRFNLGKTRFIAKIKQDNAASIELFEKLEYKKVSESKVFNEFTFQREFQL